MLCRPWVCVYVCVSTISNIFSSETTGPIEAKFHVEPCWDGGTKVYSNGPGHMTTMADKPIYLQNLKMDFSETIVVHDLKLATDDWSDKKFLLTSKLCPLGAVCPLPRGYIHVLNH